MEMFFWQTASALGDWPFWTAVTLVFFLAYASSGRSFRARAAWVYKLLLPSMLFSAVISVIIKLALQVPRICESMEYCPAGYSFPSMHAAVIFAFAASVLLYTKKPVYYVPAAALALAVAISRVMLGVHTPMDIFAGSLVGIATSLVWFIVYERIVSGGVSYRNSNHFYFRKLIHISGLAFIGMYFSVPKPYILALIGTISSVFILSEAMRIRGSYFPIVQEITVFCSKKKEPDGMVIAPLLFFAAIFLLMLLPSGPFLIASIALVVGDTAAGIIGYTFGSHRLPTNASKTWEGSMAFFAATLSCYIFFLPPTAAIFFAFASSAIESLFVKYENLLLPLFVAMLALAA